MKHNGGAMKRCEVRSTNLSTYTKVKARYILSNMHLTRNAL